MKNILSSTFNASILFSYYMYCYLEDSTFSFGKTNPPVVYFQHHGFIY